MEMFWELFVSFGVVDVTETGDSRNWCLNILNEVLFLVTLVILVEPPCR